MPSLRVVLPDAAHYVHAHAFDEISIALVAALRRLGVDVEVTHDCAQGHARVLVLAPHLQSLPDLRRLDNDAILYTWEPMGWSHVVFMKPELTSLMSGFVVWDYSRNNVKTWRSLGARRVVHVPFGYDRALEQFPAPQGEPVVDVLFYGSLNERRKAILESLTGRGLRVKWLFGVYGQERDAWIARSRLVLNMHAHEGQILELPRLAYLWANRVPVVTETNPDTEDSLRMTGTMITAPYDELVDRVAEALDHPARLSVAVEDSYRRFAAGRHLADILRDAFAASAVPIPA